MRFGVMSDTHGNRQFAERAAGRILDAGGKFIYHLGDDYEDAELLRFSGLDVRMVPGLWCRQYRDPKIPNILQDRLEGIAVACAHTLEDLEKHRIVANIYFYGHTHVARALQVDGVLHVNPGHLKKETDRSEPASYAIVDLDEAEISVVIRSLDGQVRVRQTFQRAALGC